MHSHENIVVFGLGDVLDGALVLEAVKAAQGSAGITDLPSWTLVLTNGFYNNVGICKNTI